MSFSINTDRLIMRVENESIAEQLLDFYQKNRIYFEPYEPTRPDKFYTLDYQTASLKYEYGETLHGKCLRYFVYKKEQPTCLIGSVNFFRIMHGPFSCASIGYKFDHAVWKNGYATEACKYAISIMFSNYRIHRIEARVAPDNPASIRLLERLGFAYEGIEYKSVEIQGTFRDHFRYSLLSDSETTYSTSTR